MPPAPCSAASGRAQQWLHVHQHKQLPSNWQRPVVIKYKASTTAAGQLKSPLWYAAKYGVPAGKKWDSKKPGVPDNYFLARNPTKLKEALEAIFNSAAEGDAPVGGSGSGAHFDQLVHCIVPLQRALWHCGLDR